MFEASTLVHQIRHHSATRGASTACWSRTGSGPWQPLTWAEYWTAVQEVGRGLLSLGHETGQCVVLMGNNRPEWVQAQFGIMACRGVPAPVYTTNTPEQATWIVDHSKSTLAIVDTADHLNRVRPALDDGRLAHVVVMDPAAAEDDPRVITFEALRELGRAHPQAALDARLDGLTDTETALLIYTSGTTGTPKGVQLDHGGMIGVANAMLSRYPVTEADGGYRAVSYLPLCHVAEQIFTNMLHLHTGGEVYFCPDLKQIKDYLLEAKPTLFLGVPRVWEKFQAALEAKLAETTGFKGWLVGWARRTEMAAFETQLRTGAPVDTFSRRMARKLVLHKLRERLGLEHLVCAATGAAPIGRGTLEFFASLGIVVYEGYGMSETTGVATCPARGFPAFGTVGPPLDGVELRIAEDGEILLRGRTMTNGYLHQPEQTAELLDDEEWLHTGDLGAVDENGNLRITGRKKDILITAGGKNVAPAEMEGHIQRITGVAQAVVVGDRQPYLCALITIDPENTAALAAASGAPEGSAEEMAGSSAVQSWMMGQIDEQCNAKVARYQTIKKITLLPAGFSVEGGELTPTQKVKRNVIHDKYAAEIAALY